MRGYTGKILWVDLSEGAIAEEAIPDEVYERFLSGVGLGAHVLYERIPARADPLGPDNVLGFVSGLLTGSGALFSGRWMAIAKSPLTGTWGEANCGGTFSPAIKQCGYDGIFVRGISPQPVYLYVDSGRAELRDASGVWGKDAVEAEKILMEEAGSKKKPSVACIGQAGENLSLIAGIVNDRGRMAARSGLGAVMGSKRLKAVVLAGARRIPFHDKKAVHALSQVCYRDYIAKANLPPLPGNVWAIMGRVMGRSKTARVLDGLLSLGVYKRYGTIMANQLAIEMGDAPIKNWSGTRLDFKPKQSKNVSANRIIAHETQKYHCYACPVGCGGICEIAGEDTRVSGEYTETHKPEYETVLSFSGLLLNDDLDAVFYLNELLNRAGMDSISAGATVAFAIDCYENGLLSQDEVDGLELTWGNTPAIVHLVEKMIAREGIGDLLADGVKRATERIGSAAKAYALHAGGQELPMHDPRNDPGYGLHYSVEPMPGRHTAGSQMVYELSVLGDKLRGYPRLPARFPVAERFQADEIRAHIAKGNSLLKQVVDGAGICQFSLMMNVSRMPVFEYLNAATGWDKTPEAYMEIGRRIQTLKQLFNVRQGIDPWTLKIPPKAYGIPPQARGPNQGRTFDLDQMMRDYWTAMGWDGDSGVPTAETIQELGLDGYQAAGEEG
jgi:aldehyde:ferredoxin oxidoreductase